MFIGITKIDMDEYKDKLIEGQGYLCPVIQKFLDKEDAEVLFVNEYDYAISREGLTKLRIKWGDSYINDKIVYSMEKSTEDQVVRDQG